MFLQTTIGHFKPARCGNVVLLPYKTKCACLWSKKSGGCRGKLWSKECKTGGEQDKKYISAFPLVVLSVITCERTWVAVKAGGDDDLVMPEATKDVTLSAEWITKATVSMMSTCCWVPARYWLFVSANLEQTDTEATASPSTAHCLFISISIVVKALISDWARPLFSLLILIGIACLSAHFVFLEPSVAISVTRFALYSFNYCQACVAAEIAQ